MKLSNKSTKHLISAYLYSEPFHLTHSLLTQYLNNNINNPTLYNVIWNKTNFKTFTSINPYNIILSRELSNITKNI
jgi:hypothetical protein